MKGFERSQNNLTFKLGETFSLVTYYGVRVFFTRLIQID